MSMASERKALVTGGASGFGRHIAQRLTESGAAVALLDLPGERLAGAASELDAIQAPADVRDAAAVQAAVADAASALGGLDTLVISAGVIHIKPLAEVTPADWELTLDVNLKGAFFACQAAAPYLKASGRGRIVAIASDAGHRGFAWIQAYTASKFGLVGLIESLAVELAPEVTANSVCPTGVSTTGMGQHVLDWKVNASGAPPSEIVAATARQTLLGRNATEADVAGAVLFLLSEEASFITGVAIDVDGGMRLGFIPGAG